MLEAQYSETDCRYAFVLKICVEITWRPAGALQTWVGLTLDDCKKVDKTINTDQKGATVN
jgi:hypothetical protein